MTRISLIEIGRDLVRGTITAEEFEARFILERRVLGHAVEPDSNINICAGELFILADCYTSDEDRDESELDDEGLLREVRETLEKHNLL